MLTDSPKISHITNRDIFQVTFPQRDEKYDKRGVMQISRMFGTFEHTDSQRVFRNRVSQRFGTL